MDNKSRSVQKSGATPDGCCSGGEPLLVGDDSSVGNASGFPAGEPGDGPFHGRPQVPVGVAGFFFGPPCFVRCPTVVVFVDFDGASTLGGGASCPQGAAVAPLREGGGTAGADAGGVPGGTGHLSSFGVYLEVVAVEPVFDVGFAYDWFHHRGVTKIVERFQRRTRRVRRIRDDFGIRGFFVDEIRDAVGVWGVGSGEDRGGDQPGFGFGSDMGLVPVPFAGPGLVTMPRFGIHRRYGPILGHTPRYPPSAFPVGVRFHVLARHHSQQTHSVGLFRIQLDVVDCFDHR